jgi:hypothetical protein
MHPIIPDIAGIIENKELYIGSPNPKGLIRKFYMTANIVIDA